MLIEKTSKSFANGVVYLLHTEDGYPIETTDTFLPFYTKDAIGHKQNNLNTNDVADRSERWMIGVSTMSGCPVRCKFCATGTMKKYRNLTAEEIAEQVLFILRKHADIDPKNSKEFKINYTRMGEPFLNIENVRKAIEIISEVYPNTHHYVSTIGIKNADYSWIKGNITLQVSLHSLRDEKRNWLIPFKHKVTIKELGEIRTESDLKTTINMTLVEEDDFDIVDLKKYFDPNKFFVKLSPINPNCVSDSNNMGTGAITAQNLI
jgi:adenine C2-methylase RlmN of 23S rRNA A2503 and tRNA A37